MRTSVTLGLLLVLVVFSGCSLVAYRNGVADARAAIASERPSIKVIGLLSPEVGVVDPETGLLLQSVGCFGGSASRAYCEGFNETIVEALEKGKLAVPRLKGKLLSPAEFLRRFEAGPVSRLEVGGQGLSVSTTAGEVELRIQPSPMWGTYLDMTDREHPGGRWRTVPKPPLEKRRGHLGVFRADPLNSQFLLMVDHGPLKTVLTDSGTTLLVQDVLNRRFRVIDLEELITVAIYDWADGQLRRRGATTVSVDPGSQTIRVGR